MPPRMRPAASTRRRCGWPATVITTVSAPCVVTVTGSVMPPASEKYGISPAPALRARRVNCSNSAIALFTPGSAPALDLMRCTAPLTSANALSPRNVTRTRAAGASSVLAFGANCMSSSAPTELNAPSSATYSSRGPPLMKTLDCSRVALRVKRSMTRVSERVRNMNAPRSLLSCAPSASAPRKVMARRSPPTRAARMDVCRSAALCFTSFNPSLGCVGARRCVAFARAPHAGARRGAETRAVR